MPAVSGGHVHTVGGQTITRHSSGRTTVAAPKGVKVSKPAGGKIVRLSGKPGAGIVSTSSGGLTTYRGRPSTGLSKAQVRKMDRRTAAAHHEAQAKAHVLHQAQAHLAKAAKPKLIHALNKAGTISSHAERQRLKAADPHVVLHYARRFNPDVAQKVLAPLKPKFPNLPKAKTSAHPSQGLRKPPGGSKSDITVKQLLRAGVKPKAAKKVVKSARHKLQRPGKAPKKIKASIIPGKSVPAQVSKVLARQGLNKRASAAILGNAFGESGYNPGAVEPGTDNGGLWGFTAGEKSMASLRAFAAKKGKSPSSAATQTKFMLSTLTPDMRAAMNKMSAADATAYFEGHWEAPRGTLPDGSLTGLALDSLNRNRLPATRQALAQMVTKKIKAKGPVGGVRDVKITKNGPLVHPFPQATLSRTDQGKDATGSGPIRAMADAKVISVNNMGWPNGGAGPSGQNVTYKMLKGPLAGTAHDTIAVAEGITPSVKAGQKVKKGQPIGTFYPGSSIEQLFVGPDGQALTPYAGAADGTPMPAGIMMANIIEGKSVKLGRASGGAIPTSVSTGATAAAPASSAAASSAPTRSGMTVTKAGVRVKARQKRQSAQQRLADRRRRAVLSQAITALGKAPAAPKPVKVSTTKPKAIELGLSG